MNFKVGDYVFVKEEKIHDWEHDRVPEGPQIIAHVRREHTWPYLMFEDEAFGYLIERCIPANLSDLEKLIYGV